MPENSYVSASFRLLRDATAAIDWFRNQAIEPDSIIVRVQPPGERERSPQRGDNARSDLTWIVALDFAGCRLAPDVARTTLVREGGKLINWRPAVTVTNE